MNEKEHLIKNLSVIKEKMEDIYLKAIINGKIYDLNIKKSFKNLIKGFEFYLSSIEKIINEME